MVALRHVVNINPSTKMTPSTTIIASIALCPEGGEDSGCGGAGGGIWVYEFGFMKNNRCIRLGVGVGGFDGVGGCGFRVWGLGVGGSGVGGGVMYVGILGSGVGLRGGVGGEGCGGRGVGWWG